MARLALLLLHFPRLRLLWSPSPMETGRLFAHLKALAPQPSVEAAVAIGPSAPEAALDRRLALTPLEVLRTLPGMTPIHVQRVVERVRNLRALAHLSEGELARVVGDVGVAAKVFAFLHHDLRRDGPVVRERSVAGVGAGGA